MSLTTKSIHYWRYGLTWRDFLWRKFRIIRQVNEDEYEDEFRTWPPVARC